MRPGTIVEYRTEDAVRLGAVLDVVGKTKLLVLNTDDDENRPLRDDVTFTLAGNFDPHDRVAALAAVRELASRVQARQAELAVEDLWRQADAGASYEIRDLARRLGKASGIDQLALGSALRDDDVYFRHRKGRFEARTAEQIDERRRQKALDAQRTVAQTTTIDQFLALLALPADARAAGFADASRDPAFRAAAELLQAFAADEDGLPRRHEAIELLTELEARHGRPFASDDVSAAFGLMRALGLWSPHEVVALHRFEVPLQHADDELRAADAVAAGGFSRDEREDFTGWWTVTIDDAETRDIDDGLSIRPTLDGGWEVAVHVADPDAWVPADSPLDRAARKRGETVYLPTGPIPMFPEVLATRAMSLVESEARPALTTHITFDDQLEVESWRIAPSVVSVNRRLTYAEVDEMLESERRDHVATVVADLAFIADELHARRLAANAVTIDLPEPRVRVVVDSGEPTITIDPGSPSPAHALVAEFMILTGELHARYCAEQHIPVVFRTQAPPNVDPNDSSLRRTPPGPARSFALLLQMQRTEVSTLPGPHAGLGVPMYTHATSPIRRYSDIVTQRQIKAAVRGEPLPYDRDAVARAAETTERAHHAATVIHREARDYWVIEYLRRHEGGTFEAIVLNARDPRRSEILLTELGVRARAHLRGNPAAGDTVRVRVERARPRRGQLSLVSS